MNAFWGKVIGFLLGYLLMGPVGAFFGVLIGAVFDKGIRLNLHSIPRAHNAEVQQAFFRSTFSVMGHLAKADGRVSEDEIRAARDIMSSLELNDSLKNQAIQLFNLGKARGFELSKILTELYHACYRHRDLLRFFIEIQIQAALADGNLTEQEREILLIICEHLRFSPTEFEDLMAQQWASQAFHRWYHDGFDETKDFYRNARSTGKSGYSNNQYQSGYQQSGYRQQRSATVEKGQSLHDAYGVLGIAAQATQAEIKKAYRKLMNQHHPDKLASRGLPEGMVKLAKEKTQHIRAAYDLIREARGFR